MLSRCGADTPARPALGATLSLVSDDDEEPPVRAGSRGQYYPPTQERRCTATNRNGEQCMRWAIPGGSVCVTHGGKAPQVRRKAALRMVELVDPAIATVARVMVDDHARHSDRLRAAENVLDRAGVSRKSEIVTPDDARTVLVQRLTELRESRETSVEIDFQPIEEPEDDE